VPATPDRAPPEDDAGRLEALVTRAQAGDPAALGELRKLMASHPGLWEGIGNLAAQVEHAWLKAIAGKDEVAKEAIARKLKTLRREVAGPAPAPLERLLAERIALCWLGVHHAEALYAQNVGQLTLAQGTYFQDRLDRAHRRYLSAIRALAQLRRVAVTVARVLEPGGGRLDAARVEA
jgi:hypothetical protein